jgi:N-acetylglucosaminyl-diphospho-decaprenol L-rhamnosyltransferase
LVSRVHEITAVLVSWNDQEDILAAVSSLAQARQAIGPEGPKVSLVVVENGGAPSDHSRLASLWPDVSILVNESNLGFGPAADQAAAAASGDVLFFLNPDARAQGDPFSEIARAFDAHPEAAAIAPRLLDWDVNESEVRSLKPEIRRRLAPPDREDQFTFQLRRLPSFASDARELLLVDHLSPNNPWRRRFRYADSNRDAPLEVEQAAAAALAVRREVFAEIGGFDGRFRPAWFEDVDLCARLRRKGRILYWPEARFRHRGGGSSQILGYPRFLPIYYRNAMLYRRLHYAPLARMAYRPLLAAGMMLRLLALPLRPRVPRPRRESARAYLSTLALAVGLPNPKSKIQNPKSDD